MSFEEIVDGLDKEMSELAESVRLVNRSEVLAAAALVRGILICKRTDVQMAAAALDVAKQMAEDFS